MKNAISWFEIPVADFERARKFYSTILGAHRAGAKTNSAKKYKLSNHFLLNCLLRLEEYPVSSFDIALFHEKFPS